MKKLILISLFITIALFAALCPLERVTSETVTSVHALITEGNSKDDFTSTVVSALSQCKGDAACLKETKEILMLLKPSEPDSNIEMLRAVTKAPVSGLGATRKAIVYANYNRLLDVCESMQDDEHKTNCVARALEHQTQREERVGNIIKGFGNGAAGLLGIWAVK